VGPTALHHKSNHVTNNSYESQTWTDSLENRHFEDEICKYYNIKINVKAVGWDIMGLIHQSLGSCEDGREPLGSLKAQHFVE
jgi:hypothetical protein